MKSLIEFVCNALDVGKEMLVLLALLIGMLGVTAFIFLMVTGVSPLFIR